MKILKRLLKLVDSFITKTSSTSFETVTNSGNIVYRRKVVNGKQTESILVNGKKVGNSSKEAKKVKRELEEMSTTMTKVFDDSFKQMDKVFKEMDKMF